MVFRVKLTKSLVMRISVLFHFISLSGPAYYFTLFYLNGDKLLNPFKNKRINIFVSEHTSLNILRSHTMPFSSHTVSI